MPEVGSASLAIIPSFKGFQSELERGSGKALAAAGKEGGEKFGDEAAKEGGKGFSSKIGPILKKGALLAGGIAGAALGVALVGAIDKERLQDKLAAQLGAGSKKAKQLGKVAGDLYANAYGDSLESVNDSVKAVVTNLGGMRRASEKELEKTTARVLDLTAAFDEDGAAITRAADQLVRTGLAKNANYALDIITKGFQSGANEADDLLDTFTEYGTQFRKLGIDGKKAVGLLSQGLKGGARDADLVADTFKEFSIRAIDGSELTGASFKALGLNADDMAEKIAKGGETAADATQLTLEKLRGVEDPAKRAQIAVGLFGTQSEDMGKALYRLDLKKAEKQIGRVGGAAKRMGDTLNDNAATKIETFKRQMQTKLVNFIGNEVVPVLENDVMPAIERFGDWFTKDGIPAIRNFKDDLKPAVKLVKNLGQFMGDLPGPAKIAGLATVLGGMGALKIRGGGGGLLGGVGKAVGLAKPIKTFETNPAALGGGKGGVPVPTGPGGPGKGGLAAFLKGGATPAAAAILNKYLNDWFKSTFEPKGGPKGDPGKVVSNIKLGEKAPFSDAVGKWVPFMDTAGEAARKAVEKADGALADLVNGGNVKEAREQFRALKDEARQQGVEIDVLKAKFPQYTSAIKQIPEKHMTEFLLPNFLEQFNRIRQYGSMLDGLPREVKTTFVQSVIRNNDIGESGDPRFGGFRAHGGAMHPGYSYMVGENGPERVTVGARSTVEPNAGGDTTFVLMLDGEALDYRMRRVADDRYNANRHHPTGRRR